MYGSSRVQCPETVLIFQSRFFLFLPASLCITGKAMDVPGLLIRPGLWRVQACIQDIFLAVAFLSVYILPNLISLLFLSRNS